MTDIQNSLTPEPPGDRLFFYKIERITKLYQPKASINMQHPATS